jgi:hypothetical protein
MRDWVSRFVTPSRLDEYQAYLDNKQWNGDCYTTEDFVNKLLKLDEPSKQLVMDSGTACHQLLENAQYDTEYVSSLQTVANNKWQISIDADIKLHVPLLREIWISKKVAGYKMLGKVDGIDAVSVIDHKFTKSIDLASYADSWQWKCYLHMSGREIFKYNVFQVSRNIDKKTVSIRDYAYLDLLYYEQLDDDVIDFVADYADTLIKLKDLIVQAIEAYNVKIDNLIEQVTNSQCYTASDLCIQFCNDLQNKKLKTDNYIYEGLK